MGDGRCGNQLLLSEEEAERLADAVKEFHIPRSLIILEAIQNGLANTNAEIPRRRNKIVFYRLPTEVRDQVRRLAQERKTSQQALIRHFLGTYLPTLNTSTPARTENMPTAQGGSGS